MNYIWIIAATIFGFLIGVIFTAFTKRKRVSNGTLVIDLTDPEKDIYRIQLPEDLESLAQKKEVHLDVELLTNSHQ